MCDHLNSVVGLLLTLSIDLVNQRLRLRHNGIHIIWLGVFRKDKQILECSNLAARTMLKTLKCRQTTTLKPNVMHAIIGEQRQAFGPLNG